MAAGTAENSISSLKQETEGAQAVLNSILTFSTVHVNEAKSCSFTQYINSSPVCHCAGY